MSDSYVHLTHLENAFTTIKNILPKKGASIVYAKPKSRGFGVFPRMSFFGGVGQGGASSVILDTHNKI